MEAGEAAMQQVQGLVNSSYSMSLTYILLGFSLAAALAWTDTVKYFIKHYVKVPGTAGMYHFVYAIVVTLVAVLAYDLVRRYLYQDIKQVPIIGVVG